MLAPSLYKRLSKIYNCQVLLFRYYSGAPLKGNLLALPTSIRLDWKDLPGTSALDYYENSKLTTVKSFITLATGTDESVIFVFESVNEKFRKAKKNWFWVIDFFPLPVLSSWNYDHHHSGKTSFYLLLPTQRKKNSFWKDRKKHFFLGPVWLNFLRL